MYIYNSKEINVYVTTALGALVIGTAIAGDAQATVSFTASVSDGGSLITSIP